MNPVLWVLWRLDVKLLKVFSNVPVKPDETISAALHELKRDGKWQGRFFQPIIDFIFSIREKDHCYQQWLREQQERTDHG